MRCLSTPPRRCRRCWPPFRRSWCGPTAFLCCRMQQRGGPVLWRCAVAPRGSCAGLLRVQVLHAMRGQDCSIAGPLARTSSYPSIDGARTRSLSPAHGRTFEALDDEPANSTAAITPAARTARSMFWGALQRRRANAADVLLRTPCCPLRFHRIPHCICFSRHSAHHHTHRWNPQGGCVAAMKRHQWWGALEAVCHGRWVLLMSCCRRRLPYTLHPPSGHLASLQQITESWSNSHKNARDSAA